MMRPPAPILDVRAIHKRFGATEVLRGVDLAVAPQELVFVIGPSGSGKSTLLRCCNRLEEPDSGSVWFDGVELLDARTDINATRRRIGMVFQSFNLYPHMTALGNVTLALKKVLKKPKAEADTIGLAALERVGLAHKAQSYPGSCPAVSSNAWPLPAHCRWNRRWCCSTNRPRRWIRNWSAAC